MANPIGWVPNDTDIDWTSLDFSDWNKRTHTFAPN